ncbi:thiamine-phosphate kinase, partial [Myxococcota bacterium]
GDHGELRLLTTDLLVEGIHFLRDALSPFELGQKAMAVNLSDIAAMGGWPLDALVSVAVPASLPVEELDGLYEGLKAMAARFEVNLVGGDTTGSPGPWVINLAVTGQVEKDRILYRSGAREGDWLFVTGFLGDSRGGLEALLSGRRSASPEAAELVRRHHGPLPHLREARTLAFSGLAHAMLDLSDGLASDVRRLCDRSSVGALIEEDRLPLSPELVTYCSAWGRDARAMALQGGEDYVLLVAADPRLAEHVADTGMPLHRVGRIVERGRLGLERSDGSVVPLEPVGWDHFRSV